MFMLQNMGAWERGKANYILQETKTRSREGLEMWHQICRCSTS